MFHSLLLFTISSDKLKLSIVVDAFLSAPDVPGLFGPNDLICRFTGAKFSRDNDRAHGSTAIGNGVNIVFGSPCLVVLATNLMRVSRHLLNSGSMAQWDLRTRARMETQLVLSEEGIVGVTAL